MLNCRYVQCDNGAYTDMLRGRLHTRQRWKAPLRSSPSSETAASSKLPLTSDEGYHKVIYLSCAYLSVSQSPVRIPVSPPNVLKHCNAVCYHNRYIKTVRHCCCCEAVRTVLHAHSNSQLAILFTRPSHRSQSHCSCD